MERCPTADDGTGTNANPDTKSLPSTGCWPTHVVRHKRSTDPGDRFNDSQSKPANLLYTGCLYPRRSRETGLYSQPGPLGPLKTNEPRKACQQSTGTTKYRTSQSEKDSGGHDSRARVVSQSHPILRHTPVPKTTNPHTQSLALWGATGILVKRKRL